MLEGISTTFDKSSHLDLGSPSILTSINCIICFINNSTGPGFPDILDLVIDISENVYASSLLQVPIVINIQPSSVIYDSPVLMIADIPLHRTTP